MGLRAPGRQQAGVVAAAPRGVGFGAGWTGQARLAPQEGESPRRCWLHASGPSWALPSWERLTPAGTQSPFCTHRFRPVGASAWDPLWQGPGPRGGGPSGAPHPFSGPQAPPQGGQGEGLSVGGPPEGPARTGCWPGSLPPFEAGSSPTADAAGSWAPLGAREAQARLRVICASVAPPADGAKASGGRSAGPARGSGPGSDYCARSCLWAHGEAPALSPDGGDKNDEMCVL